MVINNLWIPDTTPLKIVGVENIGGEINLVVKAVGHDTLGCFPCPRMGDEPSAVKELWLRWLVVSV